jgi:hypothetical protein
MYRLRAYSPEDLPRLQEIHARRGFQFDIPDRLAEMVVVEDEETGVAVQFIGTKATREAYMWADPEWSTPAWRFDAIKVAHEALRQELERKGIDDAFVFLAPEIAKSLGKRLVKHLGWIKNTWDCFVISIKRE